VMPTPLLGRPHHQHHHSGPLGGLPPGLLRSPWGPAGGGHLGLPFSSSLFDKGMQGTTSMP
jgi:hypothetical protein